jgi:hypothetical protein
MNQNYQVNRTMKLIYHVLLQGPFPRSGAQLAAYLAGGNHLNVVREVLVEKCLRRKSLAANVTLELGPPGVPCVLPPLASAPCVCLGLVDLRGRGDGRRMSKSNRG